MLDAAGCAAVPWLCRRPSPNYCSSPFAPKVACIRVGLTYAVEDAKVGGGPGWRDVSIVDRSLPECGGCACADSLPITAPMHPPTAQRTQVHPKCPHSTHMRHSLTHACPPPPSENLLHLPPPSVSYNCAVLCCAVPCSAAVSWCEVLSWDGTSGALHGPSPRGASGLLRSSGPGDCA